MKKIENDECKKIMLDILKYFHKICKENNINYTLIGGSLIGAIRHGGIIPWDDDVDVALLRTDYDKIIKIIEKDNKSNYKVITWKNNDEYYYNFAKIVDKRTKLQEMNQKMYKDCGVYVDIFPYDIAPEKNIKLHHLRKKILNLFLHGLAFNKNDKSQRNYILKKIRWVISCKIIGRKFLLSHYDKLCCKYNNTKGRYIMSPFVNKEPKLVLKSDFEKFVNVKFDNVDVSIVKNYDSVLKVYFMDYMKLPPEDERITHGLTAYWRDNDLINKNIN